jgi:hypothetical protein
LAGHSKNKATLAGGLFLVDLKGFPPQGGDKLRLPQAHGKNKSTLAGGLFLVDLKGFEPSTSRMRTNQKLCFVLIFSHFRRFCLECKWSCGLFFPL